MNLHNPPPPREEGVYNAKRKAPDRGFLEVGGDNSSLMCPGLHIPVISPDASEVFPGFLIAAPYLAVESEERV